jgi:purine nucleosidase
MEKTKIIIDTDIGDDADDALAISLAVKSPELELIGVTTVYRNVGARARIAVRLLQMLGREDIPVYAGIGNPIIEPTDTVTLPPQFLPGMEELSYCTDRNAVEYLRDTLMASDGDITLVSIGPMTNLAILLLKYPYVKEKIKEVVMMAGAFYMHYNEWNVRCDPEAAKIVFDSQLPIRAVGLDVTTQCPVTDELLNAITSHGEDYTALLGELLMCFKRERGIHTFLHDPMAVFAIYDRELITYRGEDIDVELHGRLTRGTTLNRFRIGFGNDRQTVQCAKTIQADKFVEKFKEILLS